MIPKELQLKLGTENKYLVYIITKCDLKPVMFKYLVNELLKRKGYISRIDDIAIEKLDRLLRLSEAILSIIKYDEVTISMKYYYDSLEYVIIENDHDMSRLKALFLKLSNESDDMFTRNKAKDIYETMEKKEGIKNGEDYAKIGAISTLRKDEAITALYKLNIYSPIDRIKLVRHIANKISEDIILELKDPLVLTYYSLGKLKGSSRAQKNEVNLQYMKLFWEQFELLDENETKEIENHFFGGNPALVQYRNNIYSTQINGDVSVIKKLVLNYKGEAFERKLSLEKAIEDRKKQLLKELKDKKLSSISIEPETISYTTRLLKGTTIGRKLKVDYEDDESSEEVNILKLLVDETVNLLKDTPSCRNEVVKTIGNIYIDEVKDNLEIRRSDISLTEIKFKLLLIKYYIGNIDREQLFNVFNSFDIIPVEILIIQELFMDVNTICDLFNESGVIDSEFLKQIYERLNIDEKIRDTIFMEWYKKQNPLNYKVLLGIMKSDEEIMKMILSI